jgi:hypothetical protein
MRKVHTHTYAATCAVYMTAAMACGPQTYVSGRRASLSEPAFNIVVSRTSIVLKSVIK